MSRVEAFSTIYKLARYPIQATTSLERLVGKVNRIFIASADTHEFQEAVEALHSDDKELFRTFGWTGFKSEVLGYVASLKTKSEAPTRENVAVFFQQMREIPCEQYSIFREIAGVSLEAPDPLDLGPYRLYHRTRHADAVATDCHAPELLFEDSGEHLIRVIVAARDPDYAVQLAEAQFLKFDHVIAFIFGHQNQRHHVSTVGQPSLVKNYLSTGKTALHAFKRLAAGPTVQMDSEDVTKLDGNARIWSMLSAPAPTKFETRILLAIEWLGQARLEMSQANALLKAAISTEILFNLRREAISPSISNQIAETMAHVVGGDIKTKLWIEKEMKRLYGLRSDVTHRGAVTFDEFDVRLLMGLASEAVMILLTRPPYKDFENEEQFIEHINNLKYSAPAPPSIIRCEGST